VPGVGGRHVEGRGTPAPEQQSAPTSRRPYNFAPEAPDSDRASSVVPEVQDRRNALDRHGARGAGPRRPRMEARARGDRALAGRAPAGRRARGIAIARRPSGGAVIPPTRCGDRGCTAAHAGRAEPHGGRPRHEGQHQEQYDAVEPQVRPLVRRISRMQATRATLSGFPAAVRCVESLDEQRLRSRSSLRRAWRRGSCRPPRMYRSPRCLPESQFANL
jgi:hypothetical protein